VLNVSSRGTVSVSIPQVTGVRSNMLHWRSSSMQVRMPAAATKRGSARFSIRCSPAKGRLVVSVNGAQVHSRKGAPWKAGPWLSFQRTGKGKITVSKVRVSYVPGPQTDLDGGEWIGLRTGDRLAGRIEGIDRGTVRFLSRFGSLELPYGQLMEAGLRGTDAAAGVSRRGVRCDLGARGSVWMEGLTVGPERLSGTVAGFGRIELPVTVIRSLQWDS
jgi:hypothetical protein